MSESKSTVRSLSLSLALSASSEEDILMKTAGTTETFFAEEGREERKKDREGRQRKEKQEESQKFVLEVQVVVQDVST